MIFFDILLAKKLSGGAVPPTPQIVDKTVTGNPLNFITQFAQLAKETVISLEPIQDLHGYDHPWVGGAGKNKCSVSSINLGGSDARNKYLDIENLPAGTYTLSYANAGNAVAYFQLPNSGATGSYRSGDRFTTTNTETQLYTFISQTDYDNGKTAQITNLQIESGNQQTSYAPYSNYCPIDGRTETSLVGHGKNLLPMTVDGIKAANTTETWDGNSYTRSGVTFTIQTDDGGNVIGISVSGTTTSNSDLYLPITFADGVGYILNGGVNGGSNSTYKLQVVYGFSNNNLATCYDTNDTEFVYTSSLGNTSMRIRVYNGYSISGNIVFKPMVRLATETDPTFEPYTTSNNLTIQFGETVYDATFTMETGELSVLWGYIASYNGETLPGEWISDRDVYAAGTTPTTGAEVVYELATPRTIQLTPNEISLLEGVNNISVDDVTGEITLTYKEIEFE